MKRMLLLAAVAALLAGCASAPAPAPKGWPANAAPLIPTEASKLSELFLE